MSQSTKTKAGVSRLLRKALVVYSDSIHLTRLFMSAAVNAMLIRFIMVPMRCYKIHCSQVEALHGASCAALTYINNSRRALL